MRAIEVLMIPLGLIIMVGALMPEAGASIAAVLFGGFLFIAGVASLVGERIEKRMISLNRSPEP